MGLVTLRCDDFDLHDESVDENDAAEADMTVSFVWNNTAYYVDLTTDRAETFEKVMADYVAVATKIGPLRVNLPVPAIQVSRVAPPRGASAASRTTTAADDLDEWFRYQQGDIPSVASAKKKYRDEAREWCKRNGMRVNDRGVMSRANYIAYQRHLANKGEPGAVVADTA